MALVLLAVAVAGLMVIETSGGVAQRARAQNAADAAALAGASAGRPAAATVAAINGAGLLAYQWHADRLTVVVEIGSARARATAERRFVWLPVGDEGWGTPSRS